MQATSIRGAWLCALLVFSATWCRQGPAAAAAAAAAAAPPAPASPAAGPQQQQHQPAAATHPSLWNLPRNLTAEEWALLGLDDVARRRVARANGTFWACFSPEPPQVFCDAGEESSDGEGFSGFQVDLFKRVMGESKINWDTGQIRYTCMLWKDLLRDLVSDKGVCLVSPGVNVLTSHQDQGIVFTHATLHQGLKILAPAAVYLQAPFSIFRAFSWVVWVVFFCTAVAVGVFTEFLHRCCVALGDATAAAEAAEVAAPDGAGGSGGLSRVRSSVADALRVYSTRLIHIKVEQQPANGGGGSGGGGGSVMSDASSLGPFLLAGPSAAAAGARGGGGGGSAASVGDRDCLRQHVSVRSETAPLVSAPSSGARGSALRLHSRSAARLQRSFSTRRRRLAGAGSSASLATQQEGGSRWYPVLASTSDRVYAAVAQAFQVETDVVCPHNLFARVVYVAFGVLTLVLFSVFTANTAAMITAQQLAGGVRSRADLVGKAVGSWEGFAEMLHASQIAAVLMPWEDGHDLQRMLSRLYSGELKALVLNTATVDYVAQFNSSCKLIAVGKEFQSWGEGFALPKGTSRELVAMWDSALMDVEQGGEFFDLIKAKYIDGEGDCRSVLRAESYQITFRMVSGLWVILAMAMGSSLLLLALFYLGRNHRNIRLLATAAIGREGKRRAARRRQSQLQRVALALRALRPGAKEL